MSESPEKIDNSTIHGKRSNDNFAIIANIILQDPDISMDAQGIATYILSLPSDWVIHPRQIWKSKNIGRDRVYKAINELCKLGYMKKDTVYDKNIKKDVTYYLSAFKEFLRHPESQDPEAQDPEIQDIYKEEPKKEIPNKEKKDTPKGVSKKSAKASTPTPIFLNIPRDGAIPVREHVHLTEVECENLEEKYDESMLEIMLDKLDLQHLSILEGTSKRKKGYTISVFAKHSWLWEAATKCAGSYGVKSSIKEDFKQTVRKSFVSGEHYNQAEFNADDVGCSFVRGMTFDQVRWNDYEFESKFRRMLKKFGVAFGEKPEAKQVKSPTSPSPLTGMIKDLARHKRIDL